MASDADYMAFLNKANKHADDARATAGAGAGRGAQASPFKALDEGAQVPPVILDAIGGAFYVSDADEPFDGVCLKWGGEGGLPDEEEFARLIQHWDAPNAEIEIMDPAEWDRHEQYGGIVDAVSQATKGNDVRVYRVPRDRSSRVEYWVVSRDDSTGSLVGVKALGVES
ncbi:Uncharacterized protein ESCO_003593 [Escovopsis weberi]|uniref:Uncharacterized protein n=1 Tax=Escovopsis weberi TaxID=150374 RepID=A0A0M8N4A0_ESCWE|nr:Uncharacterized protein ESCO_003593 [Escovopsis weberi]